MTMLVGATSPEALCPGMGVLEQVAFLHSVLEGCTECSIVAEDLDGSILTWNEGARRLFGYDASDVIGKASGIILDDPRDIQSGHARAIREAARHDGRWSGELRRVRRDGSAFTADVTITLRSDPECNPLGFTVISCEVGQLRRKNEDLEECNRRILDASRKKSAFLANLSHELRTPLNGIIGFAQIMHDGKVGPVAAQHREFLNDILTGASHLQKLLNEVLDLAKVESGTMTFWPQVVALRQIVSEVQEALAHLTMARQIRIEAAIDDSVAAVLIDPLRLKQILHNFLSIALKSTPDSGCVSVRATPEGPASFRLEVEDAGVGVRESEILRLFAESHDLDSSARQRYPGVSLSLALTRRLVEAQGGRVGVRSTSMERCVLYAVLPRHRAEVRSSGSTPPFPHTNREGGAPCRAPRS